MVLPLPCSILSRLYRHPVVSLAANKARFAVISKLLAVWHITDYFYYPRPPPVLLWPIANSAADSGDQRSPVHTALEMVPAS
jgi:hypothetical protein